MVKAVNKLILEINNTENEYFEKAVLYIRPEKAEDNKLSDSAREYLSRISGGDRRVQKKSGILLSLLINLAVATFSAMVTAVVLLVL
ncbi:MAG: hypothetical protein IJF09_06590 [Ruminiclostridium sp.]|nr:hypothetical protein [Ruminiclostridium sp.]